MNHNVKNLYEELKELNLLKAYLDNFRHELELELEFNDFNKLATYDLDSCDTDLDKFCKAVTDNISELSISYGPKAILEASFVFKDTPQGSHFWWLVADKLSTNYGY
jgi:hypothetical protein